MKNLAVSLITMFLLLTFIPAPAQLKGGTESVSSSVVVIKPVESPDAKALHGRLNEIKAMDKSRLTSFDKKELRKEVRIIKRQLREYNEYAGLSAGMRVTIGVILIALSMNNLYRYD